MPMICARLGITVEIMHYVSVSAVQLGIYVARLQLYDIQYLKPNHVPLVTYPNNDNRVLRTGRAE